MIMFVICCVFLPHPLQHILHHLPVILCDSSGLDDLCIGAESIYAFRLLFIMHHQITLFTNVLYSIINFIIYQ